MPFRLAAVVTVTLFFACASATSDSNNVPYVGVNAQGVMEVKGPQVQINGVDFAALVAELAETKLAMSELRAELRLGTTTTLTSRPADCQAIRNAALLRPANDHFHIWPHGPLGRRVWVYCDFVDDAGWTVVLGSGNQVNNCEFVVGDCDQAANGHQLDLAGDAGYHGAAGASTASASHAKFCCNSTLAIADQISYHREFCGRTSGYGNSAVRVCFVGTWLDGLPMAELRLRGSNTDSQCNQPWGFSVHDGIEGPHAGFESLDMGGMPLLGDDVFHVVDVRGAKALLSADLSMGCPGLAELKYVGFRLSDPNRQTSAEFCAAYETNCAAQPNNFADAASCEDWYNTAPAGTVGDPINATAAGGTRACYQYHLSLAPGAAATHCPHARGTSVCVTLAQPVATNCLAHLNNGITADGMYQINPSGTDVFSVFCDMTTDGGGWTMVLNRVNGNGDHTTADAVTKSTPSKAITDSRWAALQAAGYSSAMAMDGAGMWVTTSKAALDDGGACSGSSRLSGAAYPPTSLTRSPIAQHETTNCHGSGADHAHWFGITTYTAEGTPTYAQYWNEQWNAGSMYEPAYNTRISSDWQMHYYDRTAGQGRIWHDAHHGYAEAAAEAYMFIR
jgi:hypothetical protein